MRTALHDTDKKTIYDRLETVTDPEIPVLSILDMGIVREVYWENEVLTVLITPTYSGCPAMDAIATGIRVALSDLGFTKIKIEQQLSPAWTTDWMSEEGKEKLRVYGIAPPLSKAQSCQPALFAAEEAVPCPRCGSWHTKRLSEFGSTACKALYQCQECKEAFDYFKCH